MVFSSSQDSEKIHAKMRIFIYAPSPCDSVMESFWSSRSLIARFARGSLVTPDKSSDIVDCPHPHMDAIFSCEYPLSTRQAITFFQFMPNHISVYRYMSIGFPIFIKRKMHA